MKEKAMNKLRDTAENIEIIANVVVLCFAAGAGLFTGAFVCKKLLGE